MTTSSLKSNIFPNQRGFKMACLNIASLPKHTDELRILLSDTRLAITETRLNDIVSDDEVSIRGYNIIRKDRNRNGGGVCIYMRTNINYAIRNDLKFKKLENIPLKFKNQDLNLLS